MELDYRRILDACTDAVVAADASSCIVYTNAAADRLLGWPAGELPGQILTVIFPPRRHEVLQTGFRRFLSTRTPRRVGRALRVPLLRRDGSEVEVELTLAHCPQPGGDLVAASFRDLTGHGELERQRAETERLRAEAERERDFARLILENAPLGVAVTEGADHRFVFVNPIASAVLRLPPEEILGRTPAQLWPETAARAGHLLDQVFESGEPVEVPDLPLLLATGETIRIHAAYAPMRGADGRVVGIVHLGLNITRRIQAEEALQESEERFRQMAETIREVFWMSDPHAPAMLYISPGYERVWGRSRESLYGEPRSFLAAVHPEDRDRVLASLERQTRGEPTEEEYRVIRPDGSVRWVRDLGFPIADASGRVYRVTGIAMDITDRRRVEEALRTSEARFRTVFEGAAIGIVLVGLDGRVIEANPAIAAMLGYDRDALRGTHAREVTHPEDVEADYGLFLELLAGRRDSYRLEKRYVRRDGGVVWGELTLSLIRDAAGGPPFAIAMVEDVTERRRVREELQQHAAALQQANEAKDLFLAMLAHELRNPLGAVANAIEVLCQTRPDQPSHGRALEVAKRQVRHQTRIVSDLLDVSRITRGLLQLQTECMDLAGLCLQTAEDFRPALQEAGIALSLDLPAEPVWIVGDPARLAQVLANLLDNSRKFTEAGGQVTVRAAADREAGRGAVTVGDTGRGIPPDLLPHVFEAFSQAEQSLARSRGGLGLGLALVRGLVELHGGEVAVRSEGLGRGTSFAISLPLAEAPTTPAAGPAETCAVAGPLRILVVEDNVDAADTLGDLLEACGHQVAVAYSGPAGVAAARSFHPDVVLCDIGLPGKDGYAVAGELRRDPETAAIPLIAITGYGQDGDRRRSQEAGFESHLTKPVDFMELLGLLAAVGRRAGGEDRARPIPRPGKDAEARRR